MSNFMKIGLVGAELFYAYLRTDGRMDGRTDRQTDMMKPIVAFRNFANEPENALRFACVIFL
jgi:hypothetical protein